MPQSFKYDISLPNERTMFWFDNIYYFNFLLSPLWELEYLLHSWSFVRLWMSTLIYYINRYLPKFKTDLEILFLEGKLESFNILSLMSEGSNPL